VGGLSLGIIYHIRDLAYYLKNSGLAHLKKCGPKTFRGHAFPEKLNGFSLLECLITIMILSTLMLTAIKLSVSSITKLKTELLARELFQITHFARTLAIAHDTDTEIEPLGQYIAITQNGTGINRFDLPTPFHISSTTHITDKLGFKSSGHHKYAGSITIKSDDYNKRLSVSPPIGQIALKTI